MKPYIKKLKTCRYSTEIVPTGLFQQADHHTNKLHCDHPEMKINWTEKVCGPCVVYENRNAGRQETAPPIAQPGSAPPVVTAKSTEVSKEAPTAVPASPAKVRSVTPPRQPTAAMPAKSPASPKGKPIAQAAQKAKASGSGALAKSSKPKPAAAAKSPASSKQSKSSNPKKK